MIYLSFCIPTYNRSQSCIRLVKALLSSNNMNIEVIVSDNASSDDTVPSLKDIDDNRLVIYENQVNRGSLINAFNSLQKAKGKFIYFTLDKDFINASNIDGFIDFLLHNKDISCGYCTYSPKPDAENKIYGKGFEAIKHMGYLGNHPSGCFFNKDLLDSINYMQKFSDKNFVGEFSFDFIFAELAIKGNTAIFNRELAIPQTNVDAAKDKSLSIHGTHTNAFYTPQSRLKMAINHSRHINELMLSTCDKKNMLIIIFNRGLINATLGYKNILQNADICEHYSLKSRHIGLLELLITALKFYYYYCNETKAILKENNFNALVFGFFSIKMLLKKKIMKFADA